MLVHRMFVSARQICGVRIGAQAFTHSREIMLGQLVELALRRCTIGMGLPTRTKNRIMVRLVLVCCRNPVRISPDKNISGTWYANDNRNWSRFSP